MIELNFSIYGDQPSILEGKFLNDFCAAHQVKLHISRMPFNEAWPKLLDFSINGGGPDISLIGSIWNSSLKALNVLQPISEREIEEMGGKGAFWESVWQNTLAPEDTNAWGIPFTGYTYFVLYRRDLLARAGVDEKEAFSSPGAMIETVQRLKAAGVTSPFVLPSGNPFRARVHCAAAWLWTAGGEFISEDGQRVLLNQPETLAGLSTFFSLYRYLSPTDYNLTYEDCLKRVVAGQAAVTFSGLLVTTLLKSYLTSPRDIENLGTAPMPGIPWVGGSNLVIWRDVRMDPACERATLLLARFLTSNSVQVDYASATDALPARIEALSKVQYPLDSLQQTYEATMRKGRAYKPVPIWVRMMNDLRRAFDSITTNLLADAALTPEQAVANAVNPIARRFELMLTK